MMRPPRLPSHEAVITKRAQREKTGVIPLIVQTNCHGMSWIQDVVTVIIVDDDDDGDDCQK